MNVPNVNLSAFENTRHLSKATEFKPKSIPCSVMQKIINFNRTLLTRIEKFHLNLFLFSYYTGGMAGIDIGYLT